MDIETEFLYAVHMMVAALIGGKFGGHHGGYQGGHHSGGSRHGGYGGNPRYPQGTGPDGSNPGNPCHKCGSANVSDARFCQQCGTSLSPGKCSGCSAELPVGTQFIGQCGKPQQ